MLRVREVPGPNPGAAQGSLTVVEAQALLPPQAFQEGVSRLELFSRGRGLRRPPTMQHRPNTPTSHHLCLHICESCSLWGSNPWPMAHNTIALEVPAAQGRARTSPQYKKQKKQQRTGRRGSGKHKGRHKFFRKNPGAPEVTHAKARKRHTEVTHDEPPTRPPIRKTLPRLLPAKRPSRQPEASRPASQATAQKNETPAANH